MIIHMKRRTLYIIAGAIVLLLIVVAVSLFALMPAITAASSSATATPTPAASPTPKHQNIYAPYLKQYGPNIKSQIAQGLHLTPDVLTTDLNSGETLSQVAAAQNISSAQLQTIIANALQSGLQPVVDSGGLTQKQVDGLVKRIQKNPNALDRFLGARVKKQPGNAAGTPGAATPTATPAS
jgi:hypothetical protein